jgi:8-oxo-dGTP pyrophosphatase MutT (NUDIX family)
MKKDSNKVAKLVLFSPGGEVLLLKRSNYMKKFKNSWDLPGGHVQIGEEIEDGLKREVREETGITIDEATYVFQKKNDYFFYSNWSEGSISLSDEHTSFIFASEEQLDDLSELTTYYRKVIKKCYKVYKGEK